MALFHRGQFEKRAWRREWVKTSNDQIPASPGRAPQWQGALRVPTQGPHPAAPKVHLVQNEEGKRLF